MNSAEFQDQEIAEIFGADGPLAACLQAFAPRPEQIAMAQAVSRAVAAHRSLVVEAGTGTGKTLAYLVPLLKSGRRAVISTGTRTLQDQLFHRDLPMLSNALGRPAKVRLLKGRANYLCLERMDRLQREPDLLGSAASFDEMRQLSDWSQRTRTGDIAELSGVAEDSRIWGRVTSTADNCLGSQCSRFEDCHVARARQAARDADLVVVNHHLLLADLTIKEEGFGELLPGVEIAVVDEAHQFPEVAQGFFNVSVGSRQLLDLAADLRSECQRMGISSAGLQAALDGITLELPGLQARLPADAANIPWEQAGPGFAQGLQVAKECLESLCSELDPLTGQSVTLKRGRERAMTAAAHIASIVDATGDDGLRWVRTRARGFVANLTPLDVSAEIAGLLRSQDCAWIFTSATLAVADKFDHFTARLGLDGVDTRQIPSPFDFGRIARLYLPEHLPDPAAADSTDRVIALARPVLQASRGRAFLLFTSHRALRRAAELLANDSSFDYPLLVQGTAPRSRLLEQFAELEHAVLLGTATFWEGVDIRGHGLVLVVIDRLPFASPGDPLLAARLEAIRMAGGNAFRDHQLPTAVLALKQGVGRLIRDYDDYGIVMICDPRLTGKSYGRMFLRSLPPMPVIRTMEEVVAFYHQCETLADPVEPESQAQTGMVSL